MKKKRRLLFLTLNLVAILLAAGSVFLPWWRGLRPSDVALTEILPWDFINSFGFVPNVVVAIAIGLAVTLLGALLALKSIVWLGVIINAATVALWFLAFAIGWRPGQFGHGLYLLFISILTSIIATLIPRRRKEAKS